MEGEVVEIPIDGVAIAAFFAYLALVIALGIYSSWFSSKGISEFFVGGRKINRFVVALSAVVSGRSAWLLLGVTGTAWMMGAAAVWTVVGYIIVELFLFLYYARRLRSFSGKYDCVTVPDFFAERFKDRDGILRIVLVAVLMIFMLGYVASQFVAGGKTFASSFQIEETTGILLTAGIVLLYTTLGGFLAVSLTDMVQAIFMLVALLVLPALVVIDQGGWSMVVAELSTLDPTLVDPTALSIGMFIGFVGIGLGVPGNPHILARYMSINDSRQFRFAAVVGTTWNVIMAWGAVFTGLVGRTVFPELEMLPAADEENLYPFLAQEYLPSILFGAVVASIFAAIMSTSDSQLLVAASSVVRDVYEKIIKKGEQLSQKQLVLYSRAIVVLLVIGALIFGMMAEQLVFTLVLFAWAGLGASIGPTSILALYWKRTTRAGVIAGLFSGAIVTIVWYVLPGLTDIIYELVPGVIAGTLATVLVSLYTEPPEDTEEMFKAMKEDSDI